MRHIWVQHAPACLDGIRHNSMLRLTARKRTKACRIIQSVCCLLLLHKARCAVMGYMFEMNLHAAGLWTPRCLREQ